MSALASYNNKTESFLIFANLINVVSPFLVTTVFSSVATKNSIRQITQQFSKVSQP